MKKVLVGLIGIGLMGAAVGVMASPEQDRQDMVKYFTAKYPNVKIEDYVYGALAYDADSKAQYDAIMEFPPFSDTVDKAHKMFNTPFKNGKTYADCFPNGGKNIAGNYPYFDDKAGKVVTLNDAINACRVANGEEAYKVSDMKTMGMINVALREMSDGMLTNIKVEGPAATAAYEEGKKMFFSRKGQLNFSCATCHVQNAGVRLRSELISPAVGQSVHWPVFRGGDEANMFTLQKRYEGCFKTVRAISPPQGSEALNDMEYYHSYISNGLPLKANVFRK